MPQTCKICAHPKRAEIDQAIIRRESLRDVAFRYGTSKSAVARHKDHIPEHLSKAIEDDILKGSEDLMSRIRKIETTAAAVISACHEWLLDPDDSTRYSLEPRANEVNVVYYTIVGDKHFRKKEPLQLLLNRCAKELNLNVDTWEYKIADPRKLILSAVKEVRDTLELIAKITDAIDTRPEINISISQEWVDLKAVILNTLDAFPEAKTKLIEALSDAPVAG